MAPSFETIVGASFEYVPTEMTYDVCMYVEPNTHKYIHTYLYQPSAA